ncbi:MAG: spondin domain-containing protein [Gammaproteobacteria bacterium]|nr:spondin domain-containing protein [Gammaproteobacteria bacterium]
MTTLRKAASAMLVSGLIASSSALADGPAAYHVTITNLTNAISFTPILVASHRRSVPTFEPGEPASPEITAIAEAGDTSLLAAALGDNPRVVDVQSSGGLLLPGDSVTVIVRATRGADHVSLAAMMLPTNDGFIALGSVAAPRRGSVTYFSPGYDAGTEPNDEWCMHIPGPTCGGAGPSPGENPDDEGYVHIHRGIHGVGELSPSVYDWRNPVAKITVTRIRH